MEVIFSAEDFTCDPGFSAVTSEVAAMIDCLQLPSMRHPLEARSARDTLEILIASYESSRQRRAVRLPLATKDNPLLTMLAIGVVWEEPALALATTRRSHLLVGEDRWPPGRVCPPSPVTSG